MSECSYMQLRCKTYQDKKKILSFSISAPVKKFSAKWRRLGSYRKLKLLEKYDIRDEEIKECMGPTGIIYKITSPSGKVYVGRLYVLFKQELDKNKSKTSTCTILKNAIQKYGDQMIYEIIEEDVPQEHLDEREIYWIKELNSLAPNGYNCNTGGQFYKVTQEIKDKMRDSLNKSIIERNGYLGRIQPCRDLFYPVVQINGKNVFLSKGAFYTKEEVIEVLKEYTKDPKNFTKVNGKVQRSVGSVYKNHNRWVVSYKTKRLGSYETEEEAQKVLKEYVEALQSSTYSSSSESD
jgi:group I intron endonuclease